MGKDVTCDVHTWQEEDPSFEVGVTRDCGEVLSAYPHTSGRLRNLANNPPGSLSPSYLLSWRCYRINTTEEELSTWTNSN